MTAETQKSHVQNRVTCCVTVREAFKQCHAMNFEKHLPSNWTLKHALNHILQSSRPRAFEALGFFFPLLLLLLFFNAREACKTCEIKIW